MNKLVAQRKRLAQRHLHKLRHLVTLRSSPFAGKTEQEVIRQLRKTREELWEEKLASRPR